MLDEVEPVAFPLEFRRNHLVGPHRSDTERYEGRRHVDRAVFCLEGSAHRILSADGGQPELVLHLQSAEQGGGRLAPDLRVGGHPLKIFLTGETHRLPMSAGGHHLAASLDE